MPRKSVGKRPVALITGGASGIGAAACLAFARRGFDIALAYRTREKDAQNVAEDCRALGAIVATLAGDVAEDVDCRRIVDASVQLGPLHVVVNSAGATQFVAMDDLDGIEAADFERIFRVNAVGPFQIARAAAPHLKKTAGAIVNVSSVAGIVANGSSMAYVASKAALNSLTMALARVLGPDVRVNAVLPGLVLTDWVRRGVGDSVFAEVQEQWTSMSALGRCPTAEEVADHIAFLAIDAKLMTGQLVVVDSGFMLGRPAKVSK
jgi:3-oxoacyl-[acyl-carrier protein] reductase